MAQLKAGDKAPDFELTNASGKAVKLSALLEDGRGPRRAGSVYPNMYEFVLREGRPYEPADLDAKERSVLEAAQSATGLRR